MFRYCFRGNFNVSFYFRQFLFGDLGLIRIWIIPDHLLEEKLRTGFIFQFEERKSLLFQHGRRHFIALREIFDHLFVFKNGLLVISLRVVTLSQPKLSLVGGVALGIKLAGISEIPPSLIVLTLRKLLVGGFVSFFAVKLFSCRLPEVPLGPPWDFLPFPISVTISSRFFSRRRISFDVGVPLLLILVRRSLMPLQVPRPILSIFELGP